MNSRFSLERIDARPYAESIRACITEPLGLAHTQSALPGTPEPAYAPPHPKNPAEAQAQHSLAQVFSAGSITARAAPDTWLGHGGGMPGIKAEVIYSVGTGAFVAVALNNDDSAPTVVNLLLKTLRGFPLPTAQTPSARP